LEGEFESLGYHGMEWSGELYLLIVIKLSNYSCVCVRACVYVCTFLCKKLQRNSNWSKTFWRDPSTVMICGEFCRYHHWFLALRDSNCWIFFCCDGTETVADFLWTSDWLLNSVLIAVNTIASDAICSHLHLGSPLCINGINYPAFSS
jgi:hypothetical protein